MDKLSQLTAKDGFSLPAYQRHPAGEPKGGVIIIHEIFGLTQQVCELADTYAEQGYTAVVPALFARVSEQITLDYAHAEQGLANVAKCQEALILMDIQAAMEATAQPNVTAIGFCWGGGIAYLAACELQLHGGVAFYGTRLPSYLPRQPQCPFQFHFAELDRHSPPLVIEKMKQSVTQGEFYLYPNTEHAFANHHRPSYDPPASELAQQRVLTLMNGAS